MRVFYSTNLQSIIKNKCIYFDGDFLNELFNNKEDILVKVTNLFSVANILIDIYIEFEFLRDVFLPKQRILKEDFLSKDIFLSTNNHPEVLVKIRENALLLSKIYAHNEKAKGVSFVDLHLAARVMFQHTNSILLTGNKRHFSKVFNTVDLINIEQEDETFKPYYLLDFDLKRFNECNTNLANVK